MRLHIRRRGVVLDDFTRDYVKERLRAALGRFARYLTEVWVYLRDMNGPRGGVDKRCRVVVALPPAGRVVVSGAGSELSSLLRGTADRARFAVRRHLKRRIARRRRPATARRLAARGERGRT